MTKSVRVIGIGSPVAGDSVGIELVRQLQADQQWRASEEIEWLLLERPGAALLNYFAEVETVVLVDALEGGAEVTRIDPDELLSGSGAISSHHFGVAEALQLAQALGQLPPRLLLYGVTPHRKSYARLSEMLAQDLS